MNQVKRASSANYADKLNWLLTNTAENQMKIPGKDSISPDSYRCMGSVVQPMVVLEGVGRRTAAQKKRRSTVADPGPPVDSSQLPSLQEKFMGST